MQKLIEGALLVAAKCPAFGETVLAIELEDGLESGPSLFLTRGARNLVAGLQR